MAAPRCAFASRRRLHADEGRAARSVGRSVGRRSWERTKSRLDCGGGGGGATSEDGQLFVRGVRNERREGGKEGGRGKARLVFVSNENAASSLFPSSTLF